MKKLFLKPEMIFSTLGLLALIGAGMPAAAEVTTSEPINLEKLSLGAPVFWGSGNFSCDYDYFCEPTEDQECCADCNIAIDHCPTDGICSADEGDECPDCNGSCGGSTGGPGGGDTISCNHDSFCSPQEDQVCCNDCAPPFCNPNGICDFDEDDSCPDCNDQCGP